MVNRTRLFPQYVVAMITCCNHRIRRHFQPPHGFLDPVSPPASSIAFPLRFLSNSELVSFFRWCLRHMLGLPNALLLWMFLVWMQIILRLLRFPMLNNPLIGGRHSMPINPTVIWCKCEYIVHFHAFRFFGPTIIYRNALCKNASWYICQMVATKLIMCWFSCFPGNLKCTHRTLTFQILWKRFSHHLPGNDSRHPHRSLIFPYNNINRLKCNIKCLSRKLKCSKKLECCKVLLHPSQSLLSPLVKFYFIIKFITSVDRLPGHNAGSTRSVQAMTVTGEPILEHFLNTQVKSNPI